MMTSRRCSGGGAEPCGSVGLLVLGKQGNLRLVVALLLVVISMIADHGHCITPAPAPGVSSDPSQQKENFFSFNSDDADALNAVYKNWTALQLNPQLTTVLNWTSGPSPHPCNSSDLPELADVHQGFTTNYRGAWGGIGCTLILRRVNATGNYYDASVTSLVLHGSKLYCEWIPSFKWCYNFTGIEGVLPATISRLVNLKYLNIRHNPKLTGPIPLEIWQMPSLEVLWLPNNSLAGTLPSHVPNAPWTLNSIDLSFNNLSGRLQASPDGAVLGFPNLFRIDLSHNQLNGPLDFQSVKGTVSNRLMFVDLSNNQFNGTFSIGSYFNPYHLTFSKNKITSIKFANYSGSRDEAPTLPEGSVAYMPSLMELIMDNNELSGPFPMEIMQMPSLIDLNVSFNNFNDTFPIGPYLQVQTMDLSNNHFTNFTFETYNGTNAYMPKIKELHMQNNNFSGAFPFEFLRAPLLQVLHGGHNQYEILQLPENVPLGATALNNLVLTDNKIGHVQYASTGLFTTSNLQFSHILFLGGNPMCNHIGTGLLATVCRWNQMAPFLNVEPKSRSYKEIIIGISTSTTILLLMAALYVWKLMHRIASLRNILAEFKKKEVKPNLYSYREIKLATKNFDKRNKLGEGGFGIVYKGELFDGTTVAVKKLTMSSSQGLSEFLNEVVVISGLKHRNLVELKGCCLGDGDQRMLVFEYVENKNLGEALWMEGISEPSYLNWNTRFNIIIGTARGLAYLHEELHLPVIHRDIKAANILLDKNFNPKIADFGLAYLFPILDNEDTHLTLVEIAGTRGYCSPEYVLQGHISIALDAYSFGIMTLETVSGRRNIDLQKSSDEVYLRDWAWRQFKAHALTMLIDSKMGHSSLDLEAIRRVINVALACVQYKASKRPKMHDVVSMLLGNMPISNFSEDIEYEGSGGVPSSSTTTISNTTSSFRKNVHPDSDECGLLHNTHEIEMSVRS